MGRLGIGDKTISYLSSPCLVESLKGNFIEHISCGWGHSVAITESGDAFSWGNGDNG